ncbi:RNA polymerase sigma-70 factor [Larkinella rosea]|uniref:RNA polymerase sigma-70 factor n=1 Tax=Larkinella rosea TaxID=2025312 RepID=A0A3P1BP80_9BACT|nr:RNA polymerase sigma-70 factor [Larkinella rosea]RRB02871.1 RNA polymerase sigma-70 factor [Larkinella rosea]
MNLAEQESDDFSIGKDIFGVSAETKIFSDEYFIKACFDKSPKEGFELLFRKYYTNLCNHAIRYVYAKETAEDIVAEVFTNFWNNKVYEQITSSYKSYLYISVRNRAHTCLKIELNRNTTFESSSVEFQNYNNTTVLRPDEITQFHELSQKLDAAIQRLPQQSKRAFQLNRLEGKKYTEVALEMQLTVSAVERLISRALAKIREELKSDYLLVFSLMYFIQ